MLRYFVFIFLSIFLSINIYHYTISYEVIKLEKKNNKLKKQIFTELDQRNHLKAEWAIIISPSNLEKLAEKYSQKLKLKPINGDQIEVLSPRIDEGE
ncbi:MAG: hypothetical protein VX575_00455 [Pseudomonadota bacterium]|nr:hypothetical protein [Pseudomonadota bacterium]MEC7831330.1 hypothetical protein [Pseudomonadota bacterium]MEC9414683.1 hypothetical protein [Pseudomonadota bacterium]MEC9481511.1 hypothetical protein [Pseudomonadota bacterium]